MTADPSAIERHCLRNDHAFVAESTHVKRRARFSALQGAVDRLAGVAANSLCRLCVCLVRIVSPQTC